MSLCINLSTMVMKFYIHVELESMENLIILQNLIRLFFFNKIEVEHSAQIERPGPSSPVNKIPMSKQAIG